MNHFMLSQKLDGTLYLTLNRPQKGNPWSEACTDELLDHVQKQHPYSELIIKAEGPFFCTGGDLNEQRQFISEQDGLASYQRIAQKLEKLAALPCPTLAIVQGDCLGGGVELVSCMDWIVSVPHARFGFWQSRMGLSYGWGAFERLKKRLPEKLLISLLQSAHSLPATKARDLGLIDQIALASQLQLECQNWIRCMRDTSQVGTNLLKRSTLSEAEIFARLWHQPAHKKALKKIQSQ